MIGATGIWSEEEQSAHIFSYGVARWVAKNTTGTILDLGCGNGTYSTYFKEVGRDAWAVDGFDQNGVDQVQDISKPFDIVKFDIVFCIELFEHIGKEFEYIVLDNITRHCKDKVVISVAHEGQLGTGHVNCRPDWYVKALFEGKGFKFEKELTESIRQQPEGYVAYLKENLFVFTKL